MSHPRIVYQDGYLFQLAEDYWHQLDFGPPTAVRDGFLTFIPDGMLHIATGYAWDGPSGPAIKTRNFMRASLVHDALYQLMRGNLLDHDDFRDKADRALQAICREDGMSYMRSQWVYWGVRVGAGPAADPNNKKPLLYAP